MHFTDDPVAHSARLDAALTDLFPLGPYSGDRSLSAADMVYELLRYLNHATQHHESIPYPSTVAGVLGNLSRAVAALPQLARQLTNQASDRAASPRAYVYGSHGRDDSRQNVDATVDELRDQLTAVADLSAALGRALDTAHELADRLGIREADLATPPTPVTAAQIRAVLSRAGVDHTQLTITDTGETWRDVETDAPSHPVRVTGPEPLRHTAHGVLLDCGLTVAPYPDHEDWSGSLPAEHRP